jgi:magnesium chelatase family protein
MLAVAKTFSIVGVEARPVDAEVDIHRGLPAFSIVGLPDAAVRESRERVRAAIVNSGLDFPLKRITVSLAPSDLRKAGPGFDLAIAAAILAASDQLPSRWLEKWTLAGELALDGSLRPVRGALAMAEAARATGAGGIALPSANLGEARMIDGIEIAPLRALGSLAGLARGEIEPGVAEEPACPDAESAPTVVPGLADLRGQPSLRRALEVAAAGGHSMLIVGPPGAGKSMAARRLPSILPPLEQNELIDVVRVAGVAGIAAAPRRPQRPFRAPHHTISAAGLIGGGSPPRPGEVSLAHRGVLFLDELAEFNRAALEALRQPLEDAEVTIARASGALRFPAAVQLIAAANPCPCGRGEDDPRCSCGPDRIRRYRARLSGALADRIDLTLRIEQPSGRSMATDSPEGSEPIRRRVLEARRRQRERYGGGAGNATVADEVLRRTARLTAEGTEQLERGQRRHALSGRGWTRALRVARTIADLFGVQEVEAEHVHEALALRVRSGAG